MSIEVNFMIGGEAGQGVQSVGFMLCKALARGGYHIFADQDYESRIRGGHNFFRVRASDSPVGAVIEPLNFLLALNRESIDLHRGELGPDGIVIYDRAKITGIAEGDDLFGVPLEELAEIAGNKVMANTVALGAVAGLIGYDREKINQVLTEQFKGPVGEANIAAAKAGYDFTEQNFKGKTGFRLKQASDARRLLLSGTDAIALGAIAAGCKFIAGYPMTPTTPILEYMASKAKDHNIVVVQPEDEIAAINMTIGAAYTGMRAMTATSGSGFCLMVEGLGLAGITETPAVVVLGQRPGPAIGLPTRTAQEELEFAIYSGSGEFPRAVLAPATIEESFWLTTKAFNLAEKYQTPVILIIDHTIATSYTTVERFDLSKVVIDRGSLYPDKSVVKPEEYKRHQLTDSGISPRAFPGLSRALAITDSDEHDEAGHLIEDAKTRNEQVEKRMRKITGMRNEIAPPRRCGPHTAETTLIGWGSNYGAIREAIDILSKEGTKVNALHLSELWPFPADAMTDALKTCQTTYVVENNAAGQLAHLIRAETGFSVSGRILKYDGRPFTPAIIADKVRRKEVVAW
ncbi:MAG: 2-oxoacid:acceptor oxidoreductase subunit alpha [Chloroflexi bacterium]|nr:2-oxoacid:acceptor oxidoreductase subunit alpha [Chloroflexota bacterium]